MIPGSRLILSPLLALAAFPFCSLTGHAQAALLMEQPYGFFGALNPTGHTTLYFERICAETPVKLRRCAPGELGAVLSRYQGISGYDWIAIPLVPHLYSVEDASRVPASVDRQTVLRYRELYHEAHLLSLGENLPRGTLWRGGWDVMVGQSFERRIYAFRFDTTAQQDDAFIAHMNSSRNHSHYNLLYNNCADFARIVLNFYFPRSFRRSFFPDAGMTTPKQTVNQLARYARKHPEVGLTVYEIPQIPGYRRISSGNKGVAESLMTTVYAIPITIVSPYLAGGLFLDYLLNGRSHVWMRHPIVLSPDSLSTLAIPSLTDASRSKQNPDSADIQATSAAAAGDADLRADPGADSGQKDMKTKHE